MKKSDRAASSDTSIGGTGPLAWPTSTQVPTRPQTIQTPTQRISADRIVDDVGAAPVRHAADFGVEVGLRRENHHVCAHTLHDRSLFHRRGEADDRRTDLSAHLHQQETEAAGCCMDHHGVAALQREDAAGQVLGRQALKHQRCGSGRVQVVRKTNESCSWHESAFGVRSRNHGVGHTIAGPHVGHARADGLNDSGTLVPRRERKRSAIEPSPLIDVDEIDANRFEPDESLARPGPANLQILSVRMSGPPCWWTVIASMPLALSPWPLGGRVRAWHSRHDATPIQLVHFVDDSRVRARDLLESVGRAPTRDRPARYASAPAT